MKDAYSCSIFMIANTGGLLYDRSVTKPCFEIK